MPQEKVCGSDPFSSYREWKALSFSSLSKWDKLQIVRPTDQLHRIKYQHRKTTFPKLHSHLEILLHLNLALSAELLLENDR